MSGYFIHVKFKHDGVDIKLSPAGISYGSTPWGAVALARTVKTTHSQRLKRASPIEVRPLAVQIELHALAYLGCEGLPRGVELSSGVAGPLARKIAELGCAKVQRHANPVNVSWEELGVKYPIGLGLDK